MPDIGKFMVIGGIALAVVGAIVWSLGRAGFRGLPGDIAYQGQNVRFYFPVVSCIIISIVLTLGMWLWRWLSGR